MLYLTLLLLAGIRSRGMFQVAHQLAFVIPHSLYSFDPILPRPLFLMPSLQGLLLMEGNLLISHVPIHNSLGFYTISSDLTSFADPLS